MTSTTLFITNELRKSISNNHRLIILCTTDTYILQIHNIYNNVHNSSRPSVLWLYKTNVNKDVQKELKGNADIFTYMDADKILGNTYDILILQDYSALTPNILAKSFEVVKGGGIIMLLAEDIENCKMDIGSNTNRFNKRLYKSLLKNDSVIILNTEYQIVKNSNVTLLAPKKTKSDLKIETKKGKMTEDDLKQTIEYERKCKIYSLAKTDEQKDIIRDLENIILEKSCKTVCSLTAARGRGKSAALGLVVALAIYNGISSVFILAPNVENVQTLFEFIIIGLETLEYKEKIHYEMHKSVVNRKRYTSKLVIRKRHKQIIEFVNQNTALELLPDLLIIDEAAAVPLPTVKRFLKANLTFMATTINGYEGTGRSLSTKLFSEMRAMSQSKSPFLFKELVLTEPIRYGLNDPVEKWLNETLLLNAKIPKIETLPRPEECTLYNVNRDLLFAYKKPSELFLQDMVALFVASHYKNSPDDLMYMSDMENHSLFTLCSPIHLESQEMPKILVAIQCAYENTNKSRPREGNLIPWTLYDNYLLDDLKNITGLRIARIATHPDLVGMGYGTFAITKLKNAFHTQNSGIEASNALLTAIEKIMLPKLDYIGTSFGATSELIRFWKKNDFVPVHLRKAPSKITGENSIIVLHTDSKCLNDLHLDYQIKIFRLFSHSFNSMKITLCLTLFYYKGMSPYIRKTAVNDFTEFDMRRIEAFTKNRCDLQSIYDLLHTFAKLFFLGSVSLELDILEQCCLMGHIQSKSIKEIANELNISQTNVYTIFSKVVTTIYKTINKTI